MKEASTFSVTKILGKPVPHYRPAWTAEVLPLLSWRKAAELAMGKQRLSGEHWLLRNPPNVSQQ